MAIENGVVRGFRVIKKEQLQTGKLVLVLEPFSENFSGQFSDIVLPPVNIQYTIDAGDEIIMDGSATCRLGENPRYQTPRQVPRPCSSSVTICTVGGGGPRGVSYIVGEDPIIVPAPPCGPLPFVFWSNRPPPPNPYGGGLSGWVGTTYGYWGGLPTI